MGTATALPALSALDILIICLWLRIEAKNPWSSYARLILWSEIMESGAVQIIFVEKLIGPSVCVGCFDYGNGAKI